MPIINETVWQLLPSLSQGPRQAGSKNIPVLGGCPTGEFITGQYLKDRRHPKKGGDQGQFYFVLPNSFHASLPSLMERLTVPPQLFSVPGGKESDLPLV